MIHYRGSYDGVLPSRVGDAVGFTTEGPMMESFRTKVQSWQDIQTLGASDGLPYDIEQKVLGKGSFKNLESVIIN